MTGKLPDAERSRGILVSFLSFLEARLLSIVIVLLGMLATIAYFFAGWSPPRWLLVVLAAAVFSIARRKDLAAGAICTVDGNLVEGTQKGADSDSELPEKAKDNVERAIRLTLDAVVDLA